MPLDHALLPIPEDRFLVEQSGAKDQSWPDRAASAEGALCPAENSLFSCVYIALRCSQCGELRQALAELPQSVNLACPVCGRSCAFILLGSGRTKKTLPFHEFHTGEQTRLDRWIAEKNDSS